MTFEGTIGLAVGVLSLVAGEWVPKMRKGTRNSLTLLGIGLLGYSGILFLQDLTGMAVARGPLAVIVIGLIITGLGIAWHINTKASASELSGGEMTKQQPPQPSGWQLRNIISRDNGGAGIRIQQPTGSIENAETSGNKEGGIVIENPTEKPPQK